MLDRLPPPELSYFFKRQLLTHHLCKSRIPANRLRFAENESPSRVIGSLRIGKTVRIEARAMYSPSGSHGNSLKPVVEERNLQPAQ